MGTTLTSGADPLANANFQLITAVAGTAAYTITPTGDAGYKFVEYNKTALNGTNATITLPTILRVGEIIFFSSQVKAGAGASTTTLSAVAGSTITSALGVVAPTLLAAADQDNAFLALRSSSLTNWDVVYGVSSENT